MNWEKEHIRCSAKICSRSFDLGMQKTLDQLTVLTDRSWNRPKKTHDQLTLFWWTGVETEDPWSADWFDGLELKQTEEPWSADFDLMDWNWNRQKSLDQLTLIWWTGVETDRRPLISWLWLMDWSWNRWMSEEEHLPPEVSKVFKGRKLKIEW